MLGLLEDPMNNFTACFVQSSQTIVPWEFYELPKCKETLQSPKKYHFKYFDHKEFEQIQLPETLVENESSYATQ